jgi:hypothetical protein
MKFQTDNFPMDESKSIRFEIGGAPAKDVN